MQSRRLSLIEASLNMLAGLVLSFLLQTVLFHAMGIAASIGQGVVITAAFAVLSMIRSYVLRRVFNYFDHTLAGSTPTREPETAS